jgi:hypothetical protein
VAELEAAAEAATAEVVSLIQPGWYRFSHALVAETRSSTLAPPARAVLHRRAAEALTRMHEGDPSAPFAAIAHHWLAVGVDAAPEALAATERAAAAAEARVAFADAAELYERATALLAHYAPGDLRRRAEYLIRRGASVVRAGDLEGAKSVCVAAAELARGLGDGVLYARAALALGADVSVGLVDGALIHLLEQALEVLPRADNPWRAVVTARLASARQPSEDTRVNGALAHEAIAMARRLGDAEVLYEVMFCAMGALVEFERPEIRAPLNADLARRAAATLDRARQLRSLQRLAFDMIDLGDLPGFERTLAEYEVLALVAGQPRYRWVPVMFRAMRARWEGRFDDDRRLAEEAFELREQAGEVTEVARLVRDYLIEPPEPQDAARRALLAGSGVPERARIAAAWDHARAGRLDEARAEVDWLVDRATRVHLLPQAAGMIAQVAWFVRDRTLADRVYDRVAIERGRPFMMTNFGFVVIGVFDHELMRLAGLLGRWDDVARRAASALALCDRLSATPLAEQIRKDHATLLAERGAVPARAMRRTAPRIPSSSSSARASSGRCAGSASCAGSRTVAGSRCSPA